MTTQHRNGYRTIAKNDGFVVIGDFAGTFEGPQQLFFDGDDATDLQLNIVGQNPDGGRQSELVRIRGATRVFSAKAYAFVDSIKLTRRGAGMASVSTGSGKLLGRIGASVPMLGKAEFVATRPCRVVGYGACLSSLAQEKPVVVRLVKDVGEVSFELYRQYVPVGESITVPLTLDVEPGQRIAVEALTQEHDVQVSAYLTIIEGD